MRTVLWLAIVGGVVWYFLIKKKAIGPRLAAVIPANAGTPGTGTFTDVSLGGAHPAAPPIGIPNQIGGNNPNAVTVDTSGQARDVFGNPVTLGAEVGTSGYDAIGNVVNQADVDADIAAHDPRNG